jgi:TrmH family RNA methyltransferase
MNCTFGSQGMLSISQIKLIKSLHLKKFRQELKLSLAEGSKLVIDLLKNKLGYKALVCTSNWHEKYKELLPVGLEIWFAEPAQIEKVSTLKTPSEVLLLLEVPPEVSAPLPGKNEIFLLLDEIRDPGNLGTILRTCDWFDVRHVILSETTVESASPKTIQASMGSFGRINIYREKAIDYIIQCKNAEVIIAGAFMEGENIAAIGQNKPQLLIIGNEGRGISQQIIPLINKKISIQAGKPAPDLDPAESLNASVAAGIILFALKNC